MECLMARSDLWKPLDSLFLLLILQKEIATWAFNQWLILLTFPFFPKFHRFSLCTSNNQLLLLALEKNQWKKSQHALFILSSILIHLHPVYFILNKTLTEFLRLLSISQLGFYTEKNLGYPTWKILRTLYLNSNFFGNNQQETSLFFPLFTCSLRKI